MPSRLWKRWKRIAHRAAEIQSLVILTILYWVIVVPIGLFRKGRRSGTRQTPEWIVRGVPDTLGLDEARRQG